MTKTTRPTAKRSGATKKTAKSPTQPVADTHDLIRVHGARVNNLKDVSVEIPKRRLTVFTGVSGLGQELAGVRHDRGRVPAADQRDLQLVRAGLHADAGPARGRRHGRPDDGDHRRPGADGRQPPLHGRAPPPTPTPCCASCSAGSGQPHIGSPQAFSFNTATISGAGAVTFEKGGGKTREKRSFTRTGGMCPRCEGMGSVTDFDLSQLYDDTKSLNEGALIIPGYSMDGWYGRIFRGCGYFDPDKPIKKFTKKELERSALPGADQDQGRGHQPDLRGRDPEDPEVDAVQGRRGRCSRTSGPSWSGW